jgi:hypothetical protein
MFTKMCGSPCSNDFLFAQRERSLTFQPCYTLPGICSIRAVSYDLVLKQGIQFLQKHWCAFSLGHVDVDQTGNLRRQTHVRGKKKDGDVRFGLAHFGGDFSAVHAGHGVVEDDGVDRFVVEDGKASGPVVRGKDGVARTLQDQLADLQADDFVIDAEYDMSVLRQMSTWSLPYCGEDITA